MQGVENTRTSVADRQVSRMMIMRSLGWCVDSLSQTWRMEVGIVVRCNVGKKGGGERYPVCQREGRGGGGLSECSLDSTTTPTFHGFS